MAESTTGPAATGTAPPATNPAVFVTGACGRLGTAVVAELVKHGNRVVATDRVARGTGLSVGVTFVELDLGRLDLGRMARIQTAMAGCSALIHLAAIPRPYRHPDEVVFGNNTGATFAILQAAAAQGVTRAVIASSGSAYGTAWSPEPTQARYVPVDEEHPMLTADPYGLSKEVDERTAEMFCRRTGMSIAALRFHWVATVSEQQERIIAQRGARDFAEELRELWGYVDIRDAARACRLALEAAAVEPYGFLPMNIVAADALTEEPIIDLLREHAPDIDIRQPLHERQGAFAIERARQRIGWVPKYSWRD